MHAALKPRILHQVAILVVAMGLSNDSYCYNEMDKEWAFLCNRLQRYLISKKWYLKEGRLQFLVLLSLKYVDESNASLFHHRYRVYSIIVIYEHICNHLLCPFTNLFCNICWSWIIYNILFFYSSFTFFYVFIFIFMCWLFPLIMTKIFVLFS